MTMSFFHRLERRIADANSLLCVGLDPDPSKLPSGMGIAEFNQSIVAATQDYVCAYKLNFAFYEAMGVNGWEVLGETMSCIPSDIPVIGDAKRADIGNTSRAYARAIFDGLRFDAVTVNPYLGYDGVAPFLEYRDRGVFILCRTSNPGAADFQTLSVEFGGRSAPLYEVVAEKAAQWNEYGNVGLVMGATGADELGLIRRKHPELPFLVPGIGAQGGDLARVVRNGQGLCPAGLVINVSRQIIFASCGCDFTEAAARAAQALRNEINGYKL